MVQKVVVLLWVQHLQQGGGRVALIGRADLVDLVEHDHRVGGAGVFHGLEKLAGHGADVGSAMALDLCLVPDAAHGEAVEASTQGVGDGASNGRLAHPGRADQQDDRAGDLALHNAHGEELKDTVLHVREAVVVPVQHPSCSPQVQLVLGVAAPGQQGDPI